MGYLMYETTINPNLIMYPFISFLISCEIVERTCCLYCYYYYYYYYYYYEPE